MGPRRFAIMAASLCGTVIAVGLVIAAVAGFGWADIRNTRATPIRDRATEIGEASLSNNGMLAAAAAVTAIAEAALPDPSQMVTPETPSVQVAAVITSDAVHADTKEAVSSAESLNVSLPDSSPMLTPETPSVQVAAASASDPVGTDAQEAMSGAERLKVSLIDSSQMPGPEAPPVQIATASTADLLRGDANEAVSSAATLDEPLPEPSQALAPEAPPDGKEAVTSTETLNECLAHELCIDQYLWSVYQRAPKQDTVKMVERRKVMVKVDGKPRTVIKEFTRLIDEDFTWKDPKAAEKASMSLMEYVIGGMDRSFKLKLYHALHAMDDAGLSPGITSAFRDDYRQSLASGLKAANDRSYHGGSFRGGYGHGLAADLVSVKGETRAERLVSSENLWKWIDAHGKEFGIGRPYLDRDPAHVAPIDGKEYADHHRGANTQHAGSEMKRRNLLAVRDDHSVAKLAKTARSSNF
jgi:hypothetical protein